LINLQNGRVAFVACSCVKSSISSLEEVLISNESKTQPSTTRIAPWLSVADATQAVQFYKTAFGAVEVERLEDESGSLAVAQLSISGAIFWVQQDAESNPNILSGRLSVRMILTVDDPDSMFIQAIKAGASEVAPISEGHGWRVGRITDPSGHHWEIGKPLVP
jgi:PhnB protein